MFSVSLDKLCVILGVLSLTVKCEKSVCEMNLKLWVSVKLKVWVTDEDFGFADTVLDIDKYERV